MTWKEFKNKWIVKDVVENKSRVLKDIDDLLKRDDEAFLEKLYWRFYRVLIMRLRDLPSNIKYWIREKYQRSKRGWAISDAWGFDWYLARVIAEGCEWLKKHKHGCPHIEGFNEETDEGFEAMQKEWDRILDNITWTFRTAQKIQDEGWMYPHCRDYFSDEEVVSNQKFCDKMNKRKDYWGHEHHVMTREEVEKYRQGWAYFQEYFYSLWD